MVEPIKDAFKVWPGWLTDKAKENFNTFSTDNRDDISFEVDLWNTRYYPRSFLRVCNEKYPNIKLELRSSDCDVTDDEAIKHNVVKYFNEITPEEVYKIADEKIPEEYNRMKHNDEDETLKQTNVKNQIQNNLDFLNNIQLP